MTTGASAACCKQLAFASIAHWCRLCAVHARARAGRNDTLLQAAAACGPPDQQAEPFDPELLSDLCDPCAALARVPAAHACVCRSILRACAVCGVCVLPGASAPFILIAAAGLSAPWLLLPDSTAGATLAPAAVMCLCDACAALFSFFVGCRCAPLA